jgi:hypothetical protein
MTNILPSDLIGLTVALTMLVASSAFSLGFHMGKDSQQKFLDRCFKLLNKQSKMIQRWQDIHERNKLK